MTGVVGAIRYRRLAEKFGSLDNILSSSIDEIAQIDGFGYTTACQLKSASIAKAKKELDLAEKMGISVIELSNESYPEPLKNIYDPPLVVYSRGSLDLRCIKGISLVGSRHATNYGIKTAFDFSYQLAGLGFTVVSGLAKGIDTQAHLGALKSGGETIAVLGSGIARIYPRENRWLAGQIADQGALVSEFPIMSDAVKTNFPRRNRIISALSYGTVVVEGSLTSGALITANFALEQGKEVFAVPGPLSSAMSKGPNVLIKQGAKLVEDVFDILEDIIPESKVTSPLEKQVFGLLTLDPVGISTLYQKTRIMPRVLERTLETLLKKGLVERTSKGYYLNSKTGTSFA